MPSKSKALKLILILIITNKNHKNKRTKMSKQTNRTKKSFGAVEMTEQEKVPAAKSEDSGGSVSGSHVVEAKL